MFLYLISLRIFDFNEDFNGVLKTIYNEESIAAYSSSNRPCYVPNLKKDILTKPENALDPNNENEWCSRVNKTKTDKPWIMAYFKRNSLKLSGYSIKAGCCADYGCCCLIYSWSLYGSNDNSTWVKLHSVKSNRILEKCKEQSFQVNENENNQFFSMFKIIQDEPEPSCWYCMDIKRIEFYGSLANSYEDNIDIQDDEEISIIGKVTQP